MIISFCKCADPTANSKKCYYYPCFYENSAKKLEIHNKILHEKEVSAASASVTATSATTSADVTTKESLLGASKESYKIEDLGNLLNEMCILKVKESKFKSESYQKGKGKEKLIESQQSFKRSQSLPIKFEF